MTVKISDRPGSLAGYDIVLAISEEAVNAQLEKLYCTPITRGPLPRPSKLPGFAPLPQSKYLINHALSIFRMLEDDDGQPVKAQNGIDGYIECPRIRFRSRDDDKDKTYRHAHVELTFKRDDEDKKDSVLHHWVIGAAGPRLKRQTINGYTLSWQVRVSQEDVSKIMEDLIHASKRPDSDTIVPDRAAQQLSKVDSSIFTVSSIFCLFEESRMVESFKVRGPHGEKLGLEAQDMINSFSREISIYYSLLQSNQDSKFAPTVDNPFVLGYSISQKLPTIQDIDYTASSDNTPVYFQPKQWSLSVTPGTNQVEPGLKATSGTLNYCMMSHRPGESTPVDIDPSDLNAGVFRTTFFDITKSFGKTKDSQGVTQGCDGIMAFSKEIFADFWLEDLARSMLLDPNGKFLQVIGKAMGEQVHSLHVNLDPPRTYSVGSEGRGASRSWSLDDIQSLAQYRQSQACWRKKLRGESKVTVSYSSDTASIKSLDEGIDHQRKLYLDIITDNNIYHDVTLDVKNQPQWYFKTEKWQERLTVECQMRSLIRVEISSSSVGKWSIRIDNAKSRNFHEDPTTASWVNDSTEAFRNYCISNTYHAPGYKEVSMSDHNFLNAIKGIYIETRENLQNGLTSAFQEIGTKVIMPAGNVFMFSGLDTDSFGNIYSRVSYSNDGGVKVNIV